MLKMKKSFFAVALCTICTISAFIGLNTEQKMDDLLLMNIEALASGEGYVPIRCFGSGSVDCPKTSSKVEYVTIGWSLDEDRY